MADKHQPPERIGAVLEKSLKRLDLAPRLDEYGVWPVWNEVVGAAIARNAQPEKIRNGTLFVKVSSPVWMQQLQFMKEMIAEKLNHRLQREVVKNIFFMVGRVEGVDEQPAQPPAPAAVEAVPRPGTHEEFLHSIADPAIREAFKKLLKSFARRKAKA
jgi:predicted nucleic acid-binding Zn ribbon protein